MEQKKKGIRLFPMQMLLLELWIRHLLKEKKFFPCSLLDFALFCEKEAIRQLNNEIILICSRNHVLL